MRSAHAAATGGGARHDYRRDPRGAAAAYRHDGRGLLCRVAAPVTVGIESTGYAVWFHTLLQRLGHTVLVGDAAKMRAMVVRKTKTDRRDALHILDLLRHDRFPNYLVARSRHAGAAGLADAPPAPCPHPDQAQEWRAGPRLEPRARPGLQASPSRWPRPAPGPPPATLIPCSAAIRVWTCSGPSAPISIISMRPSPPLPARIPTRLADIRSPHSVPRRSRLSSVPGGTRP